MTATGKHVLEDFESLSEVEKREVLSNLLRISRGIGDPKISQDELVGAADAIFFSYKETGEPFGPFGAC